MCVYKVDEIAERVKPVAKQYGISKVYLFGSYARGEATEESDIDLLVDTQNIHGFKLGGLFVDLEDALEKEIDLITLSQLSQNQSKPYEKKFVEEVLAERKVIYDEKFK